MIERKVSVSVRARLRIRPYSSIRTPVRYTHLPFPPTRLLVLEALILPTHTSLSSPTRLLVLRRLYLPPEVHSLTNSPCTFPEAFPEASVSPYVDL